MNIAYAITRADAIGGATVHVRDLAQAMRDRGHGVTVLVGGRGPVTDELEAAGIPYRPLAFLRRKIHPLRDLRAVAEMTAALRDLRPDLVSTHTAKAGWIGRAACARLGLPAIYTPHGWSIENRVSPRLGPLFTRAERCAARWASAIVCVCEHEKRLALRKSVAPEEKLHVVHNGVRDVPPLLRAEPGSGTGPPRLVSTARFDSPKDHATLLRALAALADLPWELDLIGDGPLQPSMRGLAASLGIAARVRFLGHQREPERVLARAHLFVLSSRSEAFPRSVLEAMRAGLPVIASRVGGVPEAVTNGREGLLVPPADPDAFSTALGPLLSNAGRRAEMGEAARRAFESRFRLERMLEKTAAVYASVISRVAHSRTNV